MITKKFWCHYIGNDGNTPKRRSIELTDIHELLPSISNEGAKTPVWFEREEQDWGYRTEELYHLHVQLTDKVALYVNYITSRDMEILTKTDEQIKEEGAKRIAKFLADHPNASDEFKAREEAWHKECMDGQRKDREHRMERIKALLDYDNYLLSGAAWVSVAALRAYEEAESPILSGLKELRAMALEEREAREKERKEEERKRKEEEERKLAEAEQKEQERLTQEAEKFKAGESIKGEDVVELCRRYGIAIHLRTVHNLQQVIANINGKDGTCQYYRQRGKRRPQLDGCYKTAKELYKYLQEH